ncbi:hypothetical protein ONZ45_g8949 [Pleurotus djamor]|nr:hypothetical protein ONZ45_g8949 [Pleurotus djamor]
MATTPIDFFNGLDLKVKQDFLGKSGALPGLYANYNTISFSTLEEVHLVALGASAPTEYFFAPSLLPDVNNTRGYLHHILNPPNQVQPVQIQVNGNDLVASTNKMINYKRHSVTWASPEMTRRSLVDEVVTLAIKVANDSLHHLVLFAEEHEYDSKVGTAAHGVSFRRQNRDYILTGPIDYVTVSLDNQVAQANLTNATLAGQQLQVQHLAAARRATCPIEVKVEAKAIAKSTGLFNAGVCQAFAQAVVVGRANAYGQHYPFILTDGNVWIFSVFHNAQNNSNWYYTWMTWDLDATKLEMIVKMLVTWMCVPTTQIYTALTARRTANTASFVREHTF